MTSKTLQPFVLHQYLYSDFLTNTQLDRIRKRRACRQYYNTGVREPHVCQTQALRAATRRNEQPTLPFETFLSSLTAAKDVETGGAPTPNSKAHIQPVRVSGTDDVFMSLNAVIPERKTQLAFVF